MDHEEIHKDVIIVGGGTGGCASALSLLRQGKRIVMTEEYEWIGGQFTSQAVPPDENPYIDRDGYGCTRTYRHFRDKIRDHYRAYPLTTRVKYQPDLNPGNGWVGPLCHEMKVSLKIFNDLLGPYIENGQLTLLLKYIPVSAEVSGNHITSVTVEQVDTKERKHLIGTYFIDATECGDLLPLTGTEYVTGAESQQDTSEPHARKGEADPTNIQGITYCFAMDYLEGEDHTIEKPALYDFWRNYRAPFWPDKQLSWTCPIPWTLEPEIKKLFPLRGKTDKTHSLWLFRQILDRKNFVRGTFRSSITLVNWPQNDYWLSRIYDVSKEEKEKTIYYAKQLSLSLLYWLQKEAPRPRGNGYGYPGLRLRKDVVGTQDGLAMAPYIRESRRIKAEYTVREQDISVEVRGDKGPVKVHDSVGIRSYRIDIHPTTGGDNYLDLDTYDSQIPLGTMIPIRIENLLPAEKNIGVTHITNGCFRLHPIVWNIGEVAGHLAAYCLDHKTTPRKVRNTDRLLSDFQSLLHREGVELDWPMVGLR